MRDRVFIGVGCVLLYAALALMVVDWIGSDADLYRRLQEKYTTLEEIALTDEELTGANRALAACIRGDADAVAGAGVFNDTEIVHMEDVRQLFLLLRRVMTALFIAAAALIGAGCARAKRLAGLARASAIAFGAWVLALAVTAGAIAVDFDAAFTAFHHLLFNNSLWLLDPATDVLIRMCPEEMFSDMGIRIAAGALGFAALVPAASGLILLGRNGLGLRRARAKAR